MYIQKKNKLYMFLRSSESQAFHVLPGDFFQHPPNQRDLRVGSLILNLQKKKLLPDTDVD